MGKEHIKKHQFKKGKSGNPKGRPKGSPNWKKLFEEILATEKEIMNPLNGKAEKLTQFQITVLKLFQQASKGNMSAIKEILERAMGKNKETIDINADVPNLDFRKLFNFNDED